MIRKGYPVTNVYFFKNKLWLKEFSTRMHEWMGGNKRPPIKIDAELHRRCNMNCSFCSRRENEGDMTEESKEIEVSKERWLEIAEQSGEMGVKCWNISGIGEPMCKPDLTLSVMEKLKEHNIFGEITSNGTLWTEEMVRRTVEMGWDSVCISLDSPERETHNRLRGGEAYDRATRTLEWLKKWKEKLGRKRPTLTINAVLNKENYKQMPDLFRLGKELGVESIFIEPMIAYTKRGEELKLNREQTKEFREIAEECKELGKSLGIEPNINCYTEDKEYDEELVEKTSDMKDVIEEDSESRTESYKDPDREYSDLTEEILQIPCYYPWFYMIITADGSASHCGEKENKKLNIKNEDLEEIWFSEEFKKERNEFRNEGLGKYCDRCRPNVVGDARRIRKSIVELRDKSYLIDSISDIRYMNKNLRDKIKVLENSDEVGTNGCGDNCKHKEELERIKKGSLYRISNKLSNKKPGRKLKQVLHSLTSSNLSSQIEKETWEIPELKNELLQVISENKRLKEKLYSLKDKENTRENLENICEDKKELIDLKNSIFYRVFG